MKREPLLPFSLDDLAPYITLLLHYPKIIANDYVTPFINILPEFCTKTPLCYVIPGFEYVGKNLAKVPPERLALLICLFCHIPLSIHMRKYVRSFIARRDFALQMGLLSLFMTVGPAAFVSMVTCAITSYIMITYIPGQPRNFVEREQAKTTGKPVPNAIGGNHLFSTGMISCTAFSWLMCVHLYVICAKRTGPDPPDLALTGPFMMMVVRIMMAAYDMRDESQHFWRIGARGREYGGDRAFGRWINMMQCYLAYLFFFPFLLVGPSQRFSDFISYISDENRAVDVEKYDKKFENNIVASKNANQITHEENQIFTACVLSRDDYIAEFGANVKGIISAETRDSKKTHMFYVKAEADGSYHEPAVLTYCTFL